MGEILEAFKKNTNKMKKILKESIKESAVTSINNIMLQSADDYENIYQRTITKFYSTYSTKKYVRHGFDSPGIKKGINLYRASIKSIQMGELYNYKVIKAIKTDHELYQENSNYNTNTMKGYYSLLNKEYVEPNVILSNVMFGIRYPAMPNSSVSALKQGREWRIKTLSVKTSIGIISANIDTPYSLLMKYDKLFEKTFENRLEEQITNNFEAIFLRRFNNGRI